MHFIGYEPKDAWLPDCTETAFYDLDRGIFSSVAGMLIRRRSVIGPVVRWGSCC